MTDSKKTWTLSSQGLITEAQEVEAIEKTPLEERHLPDSIYDVLMFNASKYGDQLAIRYLPTGHVNDIAVEISHNELLDNAIQTANFFNHLGLSQDDVIGIMAPNLPETLYTTIAAELTGIALPIPPYYDTDTITDILNQRQAKALIVLGYRPTFDIWRKFQLIQPNLSSVEHFIVINTSDDTHSAHLTGKHYDWHKEVKKYSNKKLLSGRIIKGQETASYIQTSGSTGQAKTINRTHAQQVFGIWEFASFGTNSNDVLLHAFPACHRDMDLIAHLSILSQGGVNIILGPKGYLDSDVIKGFWDVVERYRATLLQATPYTLKQLLDSPSLADKKFPYIKGVILSGEQVSSKLYRRFKQTTNINLIQIYALSETSFIGTHYINLLGHVDCIGLRAPYVDCKIALLSEQGEYIRDCDIGETGTLFMKGANISQYLEEEDTNSPKALKGWFNTEDFVKQDELNRLWYVGRKQSQIKVNGQFVHAETIESTINGYDNVKECVLVSMPHSTQINMPAIYVSLIQPDNSDLQPTVDKAITEHFANAYKSAVMVTFIDEIPRTKADKIDRRHLIAIAAKTGLEQLLNAEQWLPNRISVEVATESDPIKANITIPHADNDTREQLITEIDKRLELYHYDYHVSH